MLSLYECQCPTFSARSWIEPPAIGKIFDIAQIWTSFSPYLKANKVEEERDNGEQY